MKNKFNKLGEDIINSEGPILSLHANAGKLYFSSSLSNGCGKIIYEITLVDLLNFLSSKITLQEIFIQSDDYFFDAYVRKTDNHSKSSFLDIIQCGKELFKDLPLTMVNSYAERFFNF